MENIQLATADFEDRKGPPVKELREPLNAGKGKKTLFPRASKKEQLHQQLDFSPVTLISDFQLQEL